MNIIKLNKQITTKIAFYICKNPPICRHKQLSALLIELIIHKKSLNDIEFIKIVRVKTNA